MSAAGLDRFSGHSAPVSGSPRVLHLVPALFGAQGVFGGAERYALELASHMAVVTPTTLATFGAEAAEYSQGDLRIRVFKTQCHVRGQAGNPISAALLTELHRHDVIHCHQQHILSSSMAAAFGRLLRRRVVVSDLGGGGWDISGYLSTDNWYHAHLHISQYSRDVFGHSANPAAHVIYGGVDTRKFAPASSPEPFGPVVYVGRLMPHKGINYLIEGLPPQLQLDILGRPYHAPYFEHLQQLAGGRQVNFISDASDQAILAAYQNALCVVLPSVYTDCYESYSSMPELLGQTLLEGMACGRPVICTDVASMPEIVRHGETGFIVPPNNPAALGERLQWLHQHPEAAAQMGRAARADVLRRFTWPAVVQHCLAIYSVNHVQSHRPRHHVRVSAPAGRS